jgi:hypothetical protein
MKNFISVFCAFGVSLALATETYQNQVAIDSVAEAINSQKGIEIGGTVRGVSYNSTFSSDQEKLNEATGRMTNNMPDVEVAEFVQLDLDFLFRPWDNVSANLKLRLGAGMQEYFAAAATTVTVPWLSIQGNAANKAFHWIVGDFRQLYSPLTLYSPGLDILYEPLIFARKREIAMGDALLEGNKRNLQGFNLQFRPDFGETLGELRIEALGARLRRAGYLDESGAMGNLLPNENISGAYGAANFDKFLLAGNLEYLPLNKNVLVGGSYLLIMDEENSVLKKPDGKFINMHDTLPQNTHIFAGRVGFDLAAILNIPGLVANATGEFAGSDDKVYEPKEVTVKDEDDNDIEILQDFGKQVKGNAILASLDVGYKSDAFKAVLSGNFINNDENWFNPLAQTPQFFARRILNSDKDGDLSKYGVYSPLYSSFDALYNFTPKHSPVASNLSNDNMPQANSYNIAPYVKSSWNASTLTRQELAIIEKLSDMNLQLALPNGLATANRVGATGTLTRGNGKNIEAKGLFTNLKQVSANKIKKKAVYTEFGGGEKINVLGLFGFENNPLELSGSYKHSQKEQDWNWVDEDDSDIVLAGKSKFSSDFINAGFYWRFFRKFGLSAGFQLIQSDLNPMGREVQASLTDKVKIIPIAKSTQNQWMLGLDYTVAPHAWLSISYGIANIENTYGYSQEDLQQGADGVNIDESGNGKFIANTNLPDYVASIPVDPEANKLKHKFSRNVLEAAINVEF